MSATPLRLAVVVLAVLASSGPEARAESFPSQRVVNGIRSHGHPSAVALLKGPEADRARHWCTATLIGCQTVLTAAHCVCESDGTACQAGAQAPDPSEWHVFFQHGGFRSVASIAVEPSYDFPDGDVAVLTLAQPVTGIRPSPLPSASPAPGISATTIGYGTSGGAAEDYGIKQLGVVKTASCPAGYPEARFICWDFEQPVGDPGADSNTCVGDSGGPLFIEAGVQAPVVGLTSGGESFDCLAPDQSYDTDVHFWESFVLGAGGSDLANTSCGDVSQVGDADTVVHGFSGSVDGSTATGTHSFTVPPGTGLLRVTMNASEEGGADFDLFVKRGSPPTLSDFDCQARSFSQWGACEFVSPAPDTWYVVVNRFAGSGPYQATASVFGGEASVSRDIQSAPQRRCIVQMNKQAAKVVKRQSRESLACVRNASLDRLQKLGGPGQARNALACLSNDPRGSVARAALRTAPRAGSVCLDRLEQLPDFGYSASGTINSAALEETRGLALDLFGPDLDAQVVSMAVDPEGARCQQTLLRDAGRLLETDFREALRAKSRVLRGRDLLVQTGPVQSPGELADELAMHHIRDVSGRISRAERNLAVRTAKSCLASHGDLATLFPGACATSATLADLVTCTATATHCRFCRALERIDGLDLDCDDLDDGTQDGSC